MHIEKWKAKHITEGLACNKEKEVGEREKDNKREPKDDRSSYLDTNSTITVQNSVSLLIDRCTDDDPRCQGDEVTVQRLGTRTGRSATREDCTRSPSAGSPGIVRGK